MTTRKYRIHAASIEAAGLRLSDQPRAIARSLREALRLAEDRRNHGPEGAAIVTPSGRIIYSAEEIARARARALTLSSPVWRERP